MFSSILDKVTPEYEDKINIYKVDIEKEPQIANLFGVQSIPTIVMIRKDGTPEKAVGAMNEEQLKYWLEGIS